MSSETSKYHFLTTSFRAAIFQDHFWGWRPEYNAKCGGCATRNIEYRKQSSATSAETQGLTGLRHLKWNLILTISHKVLLISRPSYIAHRSTTRICQMFYTVLYAISSRRVYIYRCEINHCTLTRFKIQQIPSNSLTSLST